MNLGFTDSELYTMMRMIVDGDERQLIETVDHSDAMGPSQAWLRLHETRRHISTQGATQIQVQITSAKRPADVNKTYQAFTHTKNW